MLDDEAETALRAIVDRRLGEKITPELLAEIGDEIAAVFEPRLEWGVDGDKITVRWAGKATRSES